MSTIGEEQSAPSGVPGGGRNARLTGPWLALRWVAGIVALLLVLVVAGGVVLSVLFASGDRRLSDGIVAIVNDAIGTDSTRFVADRVRGTLFHGAILERPRLLVKTADGDVTWASARRIRVEYDLLAFLFPSPRTLRVDVDSLGVRFAHDSRGSLVFPRFAARPKPRTSGPETRIYLATRRGSLNLDWEGIRFRDLEGQATITTAPGHSTILVERLSATADSSARAAGTVRAHGLLAFAHGIMRVDPLEIEHGDSKVRARGDWSLSLGRVEEGSVTLDPVRLEQVLKFAGVASPPGLLRGEINFSGLPTNGQADACLEGQFAGEPIDTLLVGATFTSQTVDVRSFRLRVHDAEATGSGQMRNAGDLQAQVRFRGVNPAFVPWWKPPPGVPRGSLAGTVRFTARRGRPRPAVDAEFTLDPGKLGRVPIVAGRLRVRTRTDGAASLDSAWVDVPGARLHARGYLGADGGLTGTLTAFAQDLGRMDSILAPVVADAGSARLTAEFSGSIEAPSFTARADVWGARLANGVACDTLGVAARGRLGADARAEADVTARGLHLKERPLGNAEAALTIGDRIVIERYQQALGDTTLLLRGSLAVKNGVGDAVVDSLRFAAGAIRFRNIEPVRISIANGRVKAAPMALDLSPGRLDVDVEWDVKRGRIDSRGAFHGFDVRRLPMQGEEEPVQGEARGQFLASGPIADPDVTIWLDVLHPAFGGVRGDTLSLDLGYSPGVLSVDRARWVAGPSGVDVRGTVRAPFTLEENLARFAKKDNAWASRVTLALTGVVDSLDLGMLAAADTTFRTLDGSATMDAKITGTAAAPVLSLTGNVPWITYQGVDGQVKGLSVSYAANRLTIGRFEFRQGERTSTVDGVFPIDLSLFAKDRVLRDQPLRLAVRVPDADFKIASLVSPLIGASGGRLKITADVTGTPRKPKISGSVQLAEGTLRVAGRDEILTGITLEGEFDEERLTVSHMAARQGNSGRLTGSGSWRWNGLPAGTRVASGPPGEYAFTIKATEFTTSDRESYLFRVTGTFQVQNARSRSGEMMPRISGNAVLSKGDLTLQLTEPSEEPPVEVPFLYDVTVDVPNGLFYRTVDSDVELTGKLRLVNDGSGDLALGVMSVKKGRYYFFTREIGNLKGDFTFNSIDRIDPELAVDGETVIDQGHVINVSLTGRASQPVVHLWGGKGLEGAAQADLWKTLTFGQFSSVGEERTAGIDQGASSGSALALPIRDYLFRNAERWLASSGFIDTIDLTTGSRNRTGAVQGAAGGPIDLGTVGVGKYVTRDLFLNYSRDFSGQTDQFAAEYRVTRHLLLRGGRELSQTTTVLGSGEQQYNLDLKIRLEY